MENVRKKYRILIFLTILIMGLIISIIYFYTMKGVGVIYEKYAKENIIDLKKSFLEDSVNNIISSIEQKRDNELEYYNHRTEDSTKIFEEYYIISSDSFIDLCIKYFELKENKDAFSVLILDKVSNKIIYDRNNTSSSKSSDYYERVDLMKSNLVTYSQGNYGKYYVFWGISKDYVDATVKSQIYDEIHHLNYSNDAYIWVNEVINYEGGDNYAIRRIHPNLIDTEGIYLSTNMTDIKGNHPYLTELEGVKKDGQVFFNYYLKKRNCEIVSEKLTYAKLYKDYNWIIAMGVHLDDIQDYIDKTKQESEQNMAKMALQMTLWILLLFIFISIFLTSLERWYYKNSNKRLKEEIYIDPLTKAYNRRAAISYINTAFNNFKKTAVSPALIMIDVDDFKKVNDTYGHSEGDIVLINIVEMINKHIRSTDILCRWGGEEFMLICDGLKEDDVAPFTKKLLEAVSQIEYSCHEQRYHVTISMGISYFERSDKDSSFSIKRADTALYNAKKQGKNTAFL